MQRVQEAKEAVRKALLAKGSSGGNSLSVNDMRGFFTKQIHMSKERRNAILAAFRHIDKTEEGIDLCGDDDETLMWDLK